MKKGSKGGTGKSPVAVASELLERRRGYIAAADGLRLADNPFPIFTAVGRAWAEGWEAHRGGEPYPPVGNILPTGSSGGDGPPYRGLPEFGAPAPARASTSAPRAVSTRPGPPVSTSSARPTVRVPPERAPYPRCPGCSRMGGGVCRNDCSHRAVRESAVRGRAGGTEPPPPAVEESAHAPSPGRPAMPPPPVEEESAAKVLPFRVLPAGEAAPDPHEEHRRWLEGVLEETLAAVRAGHVDAAVIVVHHSPTHLTGCGWASSFTGNVDFVHRLGALELAKADLIHRANNPPKEGDG